MGASLVYLNEPNTEIEHEVGGNDYLKFAAGSMQGWRLNMVSGPSNLSTTGFIYFYFSNWLVALGQHITLTEILWCTALYTNFQI